MLSAAAMFSTAFNAPSMMPSPTLNINMAAKAAPEPVWADPVAAHSSALSMKEIPFDPLGLASEEKLAQYREAELKHGRLAMLAALGWPAAEELEPFISKALGLQDELVETAGRAPSLLNGGLEEAQIPYFLVAAFSIAGVLDSYAREAVFECAP